MGQMIDEDYTTNFLDLLIYVPYLMEEKDNVQRYVSGLQQYFKDKIEFDEPKTLEDVI